MTRQAAGKGVIMRWFWRTLTAVLIGGLLLSSASAGFAQKPSMPAPKSTTATSPAQPSTAAAQQRVVVVEPIRVFDPFFAYPYPYAYPPDFMEANFGYVKLKTDLKDASVYVDAASRTRSRRLRNSRFDPVTMISRCVILRASRYLNSVSRCWSARPLNLMLVSRC